LSGVDLVATKTSKPRPTVVFTFAGRDGQPDTHEQMPLGDVTHQAQLQYSQMALSDDLDLREAGLLGLKRIAEACVDGQVGHATKKSQAQKAAKAPRPNGRKENREEILSAFRRLRADDHTKREARGILLMSITKDEK
jgi:hypothetical protein